MLYCIFLAMGGFEITKGTLVTNYGRLKSAESKSVQLQVKGCKEILCHVSLQRKAEEDDDLKFAREIPPTTFSNLIFTFFYFLLFVFL